MGEKGQGKISQIPRRVPVPKVICLTLIVIPISQTAISQKNFLNTITIICAIACSSHSNCMFSHLSLLTVNSLRTQPFLIYLSIHGTSHTVDVQCLLNILCLSSH